MNALWAYRLLTDAGKPFIESLLRRRLAQGKEDPNRLDERRGKASLPRPPGPLIWVHAASVGESQSSLALIEKLLRERPDCLCFANDGNAYVRNAYAGAAARPQFSSICADRSDDVGASVS